MSRPPRLALVPILVAILVAACSAPGAPGSPGPSAPPAGSPLPSDSPSNPTPSLPLPSPTTPPPTAGPSPTPTPQAPAAWAKRIAIDGAQCVELGATVDSSGRFHVAAVCDGQIHYASSADGKTWTSEAVSAIDVMESGPQVVVDGTRVHLAFTRYVPLDEGCGGQELRPVGAFVQVRSADGEWSTPRTIGIDGDVLLAVRVADGAIHALVRNNGLFYVSLDGAAATRVKVADFGAAALRVGDDGIARIALLAAEEIRYGKVENGRFTSERVAAVDFGAGAPELILAPGNRPVISWTQNSEIGGCASPGPQPTDGTYVATDVGGPWTSVRVTGSAGGGSLTLDVATGDMHLAVAGDAIRHFVSTNDGADWTGTVVPGSADTYSPVIRIDPVGGDVGIAAIGEGGIVFFELA
jgi:hypothetical protein